MLESSILVLGFLYFSSATPVYLSLLLAVIKRDIKTWFCWRVVYSGEDVRASKGGVRRTKGVHRDPCPKNRVSQSDWGLIVIGKHYLKINFLDSSGLNPHLIFLLGFVRDRKSSVSLMASHDILHDLISVLACYPRCLI